MGRKRDNNFVDLGSSEDLDDTNLLDGSESPPDSDNECLHESHCPFVGNDESLEHAAYKQILKDYAELKHLKKKFALALSRQEDHNKRVNKSKDVSTRFSASKFSSVIDSLTPANKMVIEKYGFGSLLMFDKCFVPNHFAKWVARLVNPRSANIVFNGKVVSLTKESVNVVLGLPTSQNPFPTDYSTGKSIVLSKFNKQSIPSVNFFAKKIMEHDPLSDEDLIICFLLVALNTFLCPNSSLTPCCKYFAVFEDINNARDLDWCGYILEWLLQGIKIFNRGKSSKAYNGDTIPGCLYYLAVLYLDHIDFGDHHISQSIPRISVWKGSMIQNFSELDAKSYGCYGFHPLLDTSRTCYSKDLKHLYNPQSFVLESKFHEKLEQYSGCELPEELKTNICKLLKNYCLNGGLSINMDVSVVSSLPDEMKITFCKLLQHAYSIDTRAQQLVLDLLDLVSKAVAVDSGDILVDDIPSSGQMHSHQGPPNNSHTDIPESSNHHKADCEYAACCSQHEILRSKEHSADVNPVDMPQGNTSPNGSNATNMDDNTEAEPLPVPNLKQSALKTPANMHNVDVARVMQKLTQKNTSLAAPINSSPHGIHKPICSGYPSNQPVHLYKTNVLSQVNSEKAAEFKRTPLADLTNARNSKKPKMSKSFAVDNQNNKDVISLDLDNIYVPDSVSPVSIPGYIRYCSKKSGIPKGSETPPSSSQDIEILDTLQHNQRNHGSSHCRVAKKVYHPSPKDAQLAQQTMTPKVSPEVQIIAERTLFDSVRAMSKNSDSLYNSIMKRSQGTFRTPTEVPRNNQAQSHHLSANPPHSVSYKVRNSSSDDQLPFHSPKRPVQQGPLFKDDYVTTSHKYNVSKSEVQNYQAICRLASSKYQGEDAVYLYGVRCTFWSLGESLKPHGYVNPFVVAVFCYSLFHKPNGHPDLSKRHYFFPNIADNLLKDVNAADEDVLSRAFKRSSKARPLKNSNILFFPTLYEEHWFVFAVDIKDRKFVMLDSQFNQNDRFQQFVSHRMRYSFQHYWHKFIQFDLDFDDFDFIYPIVPQQPLDHEHDSGIYAMMSLEHWVSPKTLLTSVFTPKDIPNLRIKIANELVFQPKNSGMKHRVTEYNFEDDD
ncbi:unnamed protein product [Urochloa decumbens]|uniref:Ubiquitin-like protease family profile domain-containing protein n=1 Tax=Urochloa decumbens TaxID=240449 RepID=A0ABC8VCU2_9POAL